MSELEDFEAIRQLQSRYAFHVDQFQLEPALALYTEDAVFDGTRTGLALHEGGASVRDFYVQLFEQMEQLAHVIGTNLVTRLEGDEAEGFCYYHATGRLKSGNKLVAVGRYDDIWQRTAEGWKIKWRSPLALVDPDLGGLDIRPS